MNQLLTESSNHKYNFLEMPNYFYLWQIKKSEWQNQEKDRHPQFTAPYYMLCVVPSLCNLFPTSSSVGQSLSLPVKYKL